MHRNNQGVVAPNAQAVSELTQYFERTTVDEVASAASQAAFEAAVAAAGGVPMTDLLANNDSSDSNQSGKTLIDRIQEDFPRTPSPVYGTLFQGSMGIDAFPNIHPTEKLDGVLIKIMLHFNSVCRTNGAFSGGMWIVSTTFATAKV